jgi:hypothetical protein
MTLRKYWTVGAIEKLQISKLKKEERFQREITNLNEQINTGLSNFAQDALCQYNWMPTHDPIDAPSRRIYARKKEHHAMVISYDSSTSGITYEAILLLVDFPRRESAYKEIHIATSPHFLPHKLEEMIGVGERALDDATSRIGDFIENGFASSDLKEKYQTRLTGALIESSLKKTKKINR